MPLQNNADNLLGEAIALHNQGRVRRAETIYRHIIAMKPQHADAMHLLGLTQHQLGRSGEAYKLISAALNLQPDNPVYLNNLGETCRSLQHYEEAVKHFQKALQHHKTGSPQIHINLGRALWESGDTEAARNQLDQTVERYPSHGESRFALCEFLAQQRQYDRALAELDTALNLLTGHPALLCLKGIVLRTSGQLDAALQHYRSAIALRPDVAELHHNLGLLYQQLGQIELAAECFESELAIHPNESARHLLAALRGQCTDRAPAHYVRETFDAYADSFDTHLVDKLEYRTPELLAGLMRPTADSLAILDLGCGTGLMGHILQDHKRVLVGIDLSPRMLEKARLLACYDTLIAGDIIEWFAAPTHDCFDLAVAADVLNYLGDLEPVFAGLSQVLVAGGQLLFSVETPKAEIAAYMLDTSGRYKHHPEHVRKLAARSGFLVDREETVTLRREHDQDVMGTLFLMTKTLSMIDGF